MLTTATRTIPETGVFTITEWAEALDMSPATVREYIQRHAIPTDVQMIDATVWWRTLAKAHDQRMAANTVVSEPPAKRSRRRRGKGGGKPVPDGLDLKQMKQRIPNGRLITMFLAGLSPAGKGYALAYLLDQARKAQEQKAAQPKTPEAHDGVPT